MIRRSVRLVIATAALALAVPAPGPAACHIPGQPAFPCQTRDAQIVAVLSSFQPPSAEAHLGGVVFWQNLDTFAHTVTYESDGCRDGSTATSCLFDKPLPVGALLDKATFLRTGPVAPNLPRGTYAYFCRNHSEAPGSGMVGTFIVS